MTSEQAITRGNRAFEELQEVGEAFETVKRALLETLAQTPIGQDAKVLNIHMALQNLAGVRKALQQVIDGGTLASAMAGRDAIAVAGLTRPN